MGSRGHRDPERPLAGANHCAQKHMEKRDTWPRGPLLRVVTRGTRPTEAEPGRCSVTKCRRLPSPVMNV